MRLDAISAVRIGQLFAVTLDQFYVFDRQFPRGLGAADGILAFRPNGPRWLLVFGEEADFPMARSSLGSRRRPALSVVNPRLPVRIFGEDAIRRAVPLDLALIDHLGAVLVQTACAAPAAAPARQAHASGGQVRAGARSISEQDCLVARLSSIHPPAPGAARSGVADPTCVLDSATGRVRAVLLDNGYLADLRMAAAGALAARALAVRGASRLGVVGSGRHALALAEAIAAAKLLDSITIWTSNPERATAAADRITVNTGVWVSVAGTARAPAIASDIVVVATTADEPSMGEATLRPGVLVIATGAGSPGQRQLDPQLLRRCDAYVADSFERSERSGTLHGMDRKTLRRAAELASVLAGLVPGRSADSDCIVADLSGVGLPDTAIVRLAMDRLSPEAETTVG